MKKGLITIAAALAGTAAGAGTVNKMIGKSLTRANGLSQKHLELFLMMNQWVKVKQEGKNLAEYFEKNGYQKIAVYGMSYAGETLVDELNGTGIEVLYGIDKKAESIYSDLDIVTLEEELRDTDVIVVTAITFFDEIMEELKEKVRCPVVSLEEILYSL